MILVIDNYDSFTYNLVQVLGALGAELEVHRNDCITVDEIRAKQPSHLVISPGPGRPENAGISIEVMQSLGEELPILGVCLGHQSLAASLGTAVIEADRQMHGKPSAVHHDGQGVFAGLPNPFVAGRYHSLIVAADQLPDSLQRCAWTEDEELMAVRLRGTRTVGVQFHPESVLTPDGPQLLKAFLEMRGS